MLDLQARVHFHEPEAARFEPRLGAGDELDGAGADIADGARSFDGRTAHLGTQLRRHARCGRLLDHLLVAALQRAVALD